MNTSISCKISLSKKLRAILGKSGSITLVASELNDGKGMGMLSLSSEEVPSELKIDGTETSIMVTPVELTDSEPNIDSPMQSAIFSNAPFANTKEPVVSKIAAVKAPEKGQLHKAIKEEIEVPKEFAELKQPGCQKWISNMSELLEAINASKNKRSDININDATNDREKAVLMDMKEKEEAMDANAWLINDKNGHIFINDLGISLPLKSPFNLSNLSARRIAMSRDLRGLINQGLVRFMSPDELSKYDGNEEEDGNSQIGLGVYSNHEEAMIAMGSAEETPAVIDENNMMEVTESNANNLTEEESMILNLTPGMPTTKQHRTVPANAEVSKRTLHQNASPSASKPSNPNIKPIRKKLD